MWEHIGNVLVVLFILAVLTGVINIIFRDEFRTDIILPAKINVNIITDETTSQIEPSTTMNETNQSMFGNETNSSEAV